MPNDTKLLDFQYLLANYVVTVILKINEFGIEQIHKRSLIECKLLIGKQLIQIKVRCILLEYLQTLKLVVL